MIPLRRIAIGIVPILVFGACSESDGPSDHANVAPESGNGGENSTGAGDGGTSAGEGAGGADGKGGRGGTGAAAGDTGMAGESTGGAGGKGGSSGSAGKGGSTEQGGAGGGAGAAGGGEGGSDGGSCTTVTVPLRGAGFDQDTAGWIPYDDGIGPSRPIIVSAASQGITADTDPNVAHLGGANGDYAGMYQSITIPAGAVTLTLTGYRQIKTQEGTTRLDEMAIQLWADSASSTGFIGEFAAFGNDDASNDWVSLTGTVSVEAYAGRTVDLDMWAETDVSLVTDFYVDSLSLTSLVCD